MKRSLDTTLRLDKGHVVPRGWTDGSESVTSESSMRILSVPGFGNHMLANFNVLAVVCRNVDHDYSGFL